MTVPMITARITADRLSRRIISVTPMVMADNPKMPGRDSFSLSGK